DDDSVRGEPRGRYPDTDELLSWDTELHSPGSFPACIDPGRGDCVKKKLRGSLSVDRRTSLLSRILRMSRHWHDDFYHQHHHPYCYQHPNSLVLTVGHHQAKHNGLSPNISYNSTPLSNPGDL
ncbi:hypothetical protein LSH36_607g01033, partial [Paralvinella palmiformis]